ncbi:hypothetical protein KA025_02810 [Candidatus Saccharibacteria bacterium]|nr:hypothetical protein [Candidatus Saccharibacteria bacterium]
MSLTRNERIANALKSIEKASTKVANATSFNEKALSGLSLAAKAMGMKLVVGGGNVVGIAKELGHTVLISAGNSTEILHAAAYNSRIKAEELAIQGQALGLDTGFGIAGGVVDGYNKIKDKFSKKEQGSASVGGNAPINVEAKVV